MGTDNKEVAWIAASIKRSYAALLSRTDFQSHMTFVSFFSAVVWRCEICGQPTPSPQNLIWDATMKQLVCPNCYMTLPIVSEEEQNDN